MMTSRGHMDREIFVDPDFGPMTAERREILARAFESARINPLAQLKDKDGNPIGKIIMVGTRGDDSDLRGLQEMFYTPEAYNLKLYDK